MLPAQNRLYFKGLNELRALAALGVIWHHIELYKNRDGIPSLFDTHLRRLISGLGHNGVSLFFVLSGFLITYLLLVENEKSGTVHVKNFYIRRVLRIWPLYYLVIFVSLFLVPAIAGSFEIFRDGTYYYSIIQHSPDHFSLKLILFLFILPNFVMLMGFKPVVGASQSWSIGVEE
ncbi:MAG: acyltransferase [Bacteroidetes bacterium]|nr:acyltransferase [Bacteroidota bacterium]